MIKLGTTFTKTYVVKTPEGTPLQDFESYRVSRVQNNIDTNLSECEFQRGTGRTTKMVIDAIEHLINNPNDNVAIFAHSRHMRTKIRERMEHYASQYSWALNASTVLKRVFFATDGKDLRGVRASVTFFDNVFSDLERRDEIKELKQ